MKQSVFTTVLLVLTLALSAVIYYFLLPKFIQDGGPIVIFLLALSMMVITFIIERTLSLRRAEGKGSLQKFLRDVVEAAKVKKFDEAIEMCKRQQGACANVLLAALERYLVVQRRGLSIEKQVTEVKRMIEEATALETPVLEKNLLAISTIASIATMVGLFQLSLGISEALVNTAGGLFAAITAIVAYNVFVNKVDNMTFMLDEAAFEIVEIIGGEEDKK
jgi:biopolymer transport protein ExbB